MNVKEIEIDEMVDKKGEGDIYEEGLIYGYKKDR